MPCSISPLLTALRRACLGGPLRGALPVADGEGVVLAGNEDGARAWPSSRKVEALQAGSARAAGTDVLYAGRSSLAERLEQNGTGWTLSAYGKETLDAIALQSNRRPRKRFGFNSVTELHSGSASAYLRLLDRSAVWGSARILA